MFILYDIIYIIFALVYFPFLMIKKKWHPGFKMRCGFIPADLRKILEAKENIWFHAVSVGEVLAVVGLIKKIKETFPHHQIVLSAVTPTGYRLAQDQLTEGEVVIYAPLDFSFIIWRYLKAIAPKIYISAETEIWPNLFAALANRKVPIVEVNGRISEKSFRNYRRVKGLLKNVLNGVTMFCMQSLADAQRMAELGVEAEKILVAGNMKFDDVASGAVNGSFKLNYRPEEMVWVAGSTHPGEEKIILETFDLLQKEFPHFRLMVAPRHVERAGEVVGLVKEQGLTPRLFSQAHKGGINSAEVVVVDTIGHLKELYRLATVVFVGKSLVGEGGQNIIEPAVFAKPIIVGPNMQNFRNILVLFQEAQAIVQIKDAAELPSQMRLLLRDPHRREKIGDAAQHVVQENQGATLKTYQIVSRLISR